MSPEQHIEHLRVLHDLAEKRATAAEVEMARFRVALAEAEADGVPLARLHATFGEKIVDAALARAQVERARREWPTMPKALAVERVLREARGPVRPSEIVLILDGHGRDDSVLDVSAALQYLERKGRAHRPAYGAWLIGPGENPRA